MVSDNRIVRAVRRAFVGPQRTELIDNIRAQVEVTIEGVELAGAFARGEVDAEEAARRIREMEKRGDGHRGELVQAMAHTLVTPIDREDLFRLSRSVDDVLDNIRDFIREATLFGISPVAEVHEALGPLADGMRELGRAVAYLQDRPREAMEATLRTKKGAHAIREAYQSGIAELFDRELTSDTLKNRELLRRLDITGLRLNEAADALADGALKRTT
jgi:uncharacterized protein